VQSLADAPHSSQLQRTAICCNLQKNLREVCPLAFGLGLGLGLRQHFLKIEGTLLTAGTLKLWLSNLVM